MLASNNRIALKIQEIAQWLAFLKRMMKRRARYKVGTDLKSCTTVSVVRKI